MKFGLRRTAIDEDDGFTLVETIVAFAILSIVITIALQIIGGGSLRARMGQQKSTALAHAQSQLAMLSASDVLEPGITEGTFKDGFAWRSIISLTTLEQSPTAVAPYLVQVAVRPPDELAGEVALTTILLAAPPGQAP
jgi:general secretion pathway protein I